MSEKVRKFPKKASNAASNDGNGPGQDLKSWKVSDSQRELLMVQARRHESELDILRRYQARERNELLYAFMQELGVPQGLPVTMNLDSLTFTESPPQPKPLVQ